MGGRDCKSATALKQTNTAEKRPKKVEEPLNSTSESEGDISLNDESDSFEEMEKIVALVVGKITIIQRKPMTGYSALHGAAGFTNHV